MAKSRNQEDPELKVAPWWVTDTASLMRYINSELGSTVDDLSDVIEILREEKNYALADRLRTIAGKVARLQRPTLARDNSDPNLIRNIAKGWT